MFTSDDPYFEPREIVHSDAFVSEFFSPPVASPENSQLFNHILRRNSYVRVTITAQLLLETTSTGNVRTKYIH